jgi:hypothetical protein
LVYLQQRVALLPDEGRRSVGGDCKIVPVGLDLALGDKEESGVTLGAIYDLRTILTFAGRRACASELCANLRS